MDDRRAGYLELMSDWIDVPLDAKMFQNVDETALTRAHATLENGFVTEAAGFSRWPGLVDFCALPSQGRIYLTFWGDDMIAQTQAGRLYRINRAGTAQDMTDVVLGGGLRPTFAQTDDYLAMAAGSQILGFDGKKTFVLSNDAPEATHVGFLDGFLLANEKDSGRFSYSTAGDVRIWDALDTIAAAGSSDPVTALFVTPFREILVCGPQSVEQYERLSSGDVPFFRRWSVAEGIAHPYTLAFGDNAAWGVNQNAEFVRFSGQISQSVSDDLGRTLSGIDNWDEAWAQEIQIKGQKFILLAAPNATNVKSSSCWPHPTRPTCTARRESPSCSTIGNSAGPRFGPGTPTRASPSATRSGPSRACGTRTLSGPRTQSIASIPARTTSQAELPGCCFARLTSPSWAKPGSTICGFA